MICPLAGRYLLALCMLSGCSVAALWLSSVALWLFSDCSLAGLWLLPGWSLAAVGLQLLFLAAVWLVCYCCVVAVAAM